MQAREAQRKSRNDEMWKDGVHILCGEATFPLKCYSNSEGEMFYIHQRGNQRHHAGSFGRADERKVHPWQIFLEDTEEMKI